MQKFGPVRRFAIIAAVGWLKMSQSDEVPISSTSVPEENDVKTGTRLEDREGHSPS